MTSNNDTVAVLYSGGSDSTLSTVLIQDKYKKIHLVSYERFGVFSIRNTEVYVKTLKEKYGEDKFVHSVINIDKLFKYLSYHSFFKNLGKHRFFLLSTCGFCKLAMHVRTIVYCLEHNISAVCDGANKGMDIYPAQMKPVLDLVQDLYESFGITYLTPVFDYDPPNEKGFILEENARLLEFKERASTEGDAPANKAGGEADNTGTGDREQPGNTTEAKLYQLGITPQPRVKGSKFDKERQGRCFQLILFRIFALKYFLAAHSMEEYTRRTVNLFDDKSRLAHDIIQEYRETGKRKKLFA